MGRTMVALGLCALLAGLAARPARACIPIPDTSGVTDIDSRRAVIWIKLWTFELILQNRYTGTAKDFAWVVPLPGVPLEVDQPQEHFFEDLDVYTAPMIEQRACVTPCATKGGMDAFMLGPEVAPPKVTLWSSGTLGELEWQVLSAQDSQALTAWLVDQGFQLPTALRPLIDSYLADGFVFFAAKLASGVTQPAAVPPVRFSFNRSNTPLLYPIRISAFNRTKPLDTTLWVVAEEGTYLPTNYPVGRIVETEHTESSYAAALDKAMAQNSGTTFVVQYAERPHDHWKRTALIQQYGSAQLHALTGMTSWTNPCHIVRLRARLDPNGMTKDLTLEKTAQPEREDGWYFTPCPGGVKTEPCPGERDSGCQLGGAPLLGVACLLVLAPVVALLRRRRR
jgi:hypothetical protein